MKAKLVFVYFFSVTTLQAIPTYSQDVFKHVKPWLYAFDSLDTLDAKRMQPPGFLLGGKNVGNSDAHLFSNFFSPLSETQSFSDSVQALWVSHYASGFLPVEDRATAVAVDGSGNVYVTGYSRGSSTSDDYATVKYNASGIQQWVARYNGPANVNANDRATTLAVDAAGNVYVTGYSRGSGTSDDYATIKYNASGIEQ